MENKLSHNIMKDHPFACNLFFFNKGLWRHLLKGLETGGSFSILKMYLQKIEVDLMMII